MPNTEAIYQSYITYEEGSKSGLIELREEQKAAVKAAKEYFEKSVDNQRFLWNAKMRFGKTFCAMQLAIEMGESEVDTKGKKDSKPISRVLIITHKPVVQDGFATDLKKLQESLKAKKQLTREWGFGTRSENDDFGNFYELEKNVKSQNSPYVFFSSTQWLCYSKEVGGAIDDPLRKDILNNDWDLVVIDEAHEGILADRGSEVISKLQKCKPKMLYMSGTPFNLLEGTKRFREDQIFSWDYTQEQKAKRDWPLKHKNKTNPYQDLPQMNIFAYDLGNLIPGKDYKKGDIFSFTEFFRTYTGNPKIDDPVGKTLQVSEDKIGTFVHEDDVKNFLDLMCKEDDKSNYPFSTKEYRRNFKHTLWIVPRVASAKALEKLLEKHRLFGRKDVFQIVNVAGTNDDDEKVEDLKRVENAVSGSKYTITISCARLTTGVTIPQWTAVFYMKGSENSSAATYMQTIFRVQSPHKIDGMMKANCYVFDFAPDRSLKVVAETAKYARKSLSKSRMNKGYTQDDEDKMAEFIKFCPIFRPVIAKGGEMVKYETDALLHKLNAVYIDRIVRNGFDDSNLYDYKKLLDLSEGIINKGHDILAKNGLLNSNSPKAESKDTRLSKAGLNGKGGSSKSIKYTKTDEERYQKDIERGKFSGTFEDWLYQREVDKVEKAERDKRIKIIKAISLRIPLLMFGADVDNEEIGITIDNITERVDDASWNEFMPNGVSKDYFNEIKACYNSQMFKDAGRKYRDMAREADEMHTEERIARIAQIFDLFKNPDKETVLTPWRVVNLHMSSTLGGDCFYNETFTGPNTKVIKDENEEEQTVVSRMPRHIGKDNNPVSEELFNNIDEKAGESKTKILEINSKTGLYPLYIAYSIYSQLKPYYEEAFKEPVAVDDEHAVWDTVLKNNIYVICNTEMAARITYRTLAGYRPIKGVDTSTLSDEHYIKGMHIVSDKLVEKAISDKDSLIKEMKTLGYWNKNDKNNEKEMKFNAIVGNPPYQEKIDSSRSLAKQHFPVFIELGIKMNADYLSLITPARWFTADAQDNSFPKLRAFVKENNHFSRMISYKGKLLFPSTDLSMVSMFLWSKKYRGDVCFVEHFGEENSLYRPLFEKGLDIILPSNNIVSILKKVIANNHIPLNTITTGRDAFGIVGKNFADISSDSYFEGSVSVQCAYEEIRYYEKSLITKNKEILEGYKIFTSKGNGGAGLLTDGKSVAIIGKAFVAGPDTACTDSLIPFGCFNDCEQAINLQKYFSTKFLRFLVGILKVSQNLYQNVYEFVPIQDFTNNSDIDWCKSISEIDQQLYDKYNLCPSEKDYIEKVIKPME